MGRKRKVPRKNSQFQNKPKSITILGSSNNIKSHELAQFPLKPTNKSLPSGSAHLLKPNNYASQINSVDKKSLYIIFLSFNHFLRFEKQISTLPLSFVKRVTQTISVLSSFGLKVKTNLIVATPMYRLSPSTWDIQQKEIEKLEVVLKEKGIYYFNPQESIDATTLETDFYKKIEFIIHPE